MGSIKPGTAKLVQVDKQGIGRVASNSRTQFHDQFLKFRFNFAQLKFQLRKPGLRAACLSGSPPLDIRCPRS